VTQLIKDTISCGLVDTGYRRSQTNVSHWVQLWTVHQGAL